MKKERKKDMGARTKAIKVEEREREKCDEREERRLGD